MVFGSLRRNRSNNSSVAQIESRLSNLSALGRHLDASPENVVGALGLNLLNTPSEPLIDFVFVHGLRGGSRKTWSHSNAAYHYWPREWLPYDPEFLNVRIHSFGYNSDWGETKDSVLNIHDFGKSLLSEVANSPEIRRDGDTPIVFIGHSMGGLVIKKAYILARQDPLFQPIANRVYGIVFLATPHRGAESATLLKNLLHASFSHSSKPFVSDLERNSGALQAINDEFRHHCATIFLHSFYETLKTSLGVSTALIVPKDSATLGYPNEESALLNANHRSICKFESPSDPNFISVRNVLVTITRDISRKALASKRDIFRAQLKEISMFLGVSDLQDDDLSAFEDAHLQGSCSWLTSKESFRAWIDPANTGVPHYLVSGQPGSGKSMLAFHTLRVLQDLGGNVAFHFFTLRDKTKSSLSTGLRSLAYQMAYTSPTVRQALHDMFTDNKRLDLDNEPSLWKRLFVQCIFEVPYDKPYFWVLDALDESTGQYTFTHLLTKLDDRCPVKVFMTTRPSAESQREIEQPHKLGFVEIITAEDTAFDIELFLANQMENIPLATSEARKQASQSIKKRSEGCFLWVVLVIQELKTAYSEERVEQVIAELPQGMNSMYKRALNSMLSALQGKHVLKALLMWTACGTRPLSISELEQALKIDIGETVAVERLVKQSCAQLLHIDKSGRVMLIHQTARDFLLSKESESEMAFTRKAGHGHLADICLKYLTSDELKPPRNAKLMQIHRNKILKRSTFADYAACSFSEHIRRSEASEDDRLLMLDKFLKTNALTWIEHLARLNKLHYLVSTAKSLKGYLGTRAKYKPLIGQEVQRINTWSLDLVRLVVQFGKALISAPSAIYWLIPPFCPSNSALAAWTQFTSSTISVVGVSNNAWSDRLHCINYQHNRDASAVAASDERFAVGLSNGIVRLYYRNTCHRAREIANTESARHLVFSESGKLLSINTRRTLSVWNTETGEKLWHIPTRTECLLMRFVDKDSKLLLLSKSGNVATILVATRAVVSNVALQIPDDEEAAFRRNFSCADVSVNLNMVAVACRGMPADLYILEDGSYLGRCGRESEEEIENSHRGLQPIRQILFHPLEEVCRMAVIYQDGDLALLDPADLSLQTLVEAEAQTMECTPDGRLLVTGDSFGTIKVFEFETLKIQYKILAPGHAIRGLAFAKDGLQLLDIRGNQFNVWDPPILMQGDEGEASSISEAISLGPTVVGVSDQTQDFEITVIETHHLGNTVFCGTNHGQILVHSISSGQQQNVLYKQENSTYLRLIQWNRQKNLLAFVDSWNRLIVCSVTGVQEKWSKNESIVDTHIPDHTIKQILFDSSGDSILVSTARSDTVINLIDGTRRSIEREHRDAWKWCTGYDPTQLVSVTLDRIEIHSWIEFDKPAQKKGHTMKTGLEGDELIKSVTNLGEKADLLVEFEHSGGNQSTAHVLLFRSASLESQALTNENNQDTSDRPLPLVPSTQYLRLKDSVEHIIGQYGKLLIFLDRSFWVSSIDVSNNPATAFSETKAQYCRHFFLSEEWMSSNRRLLISVTSKGDVVFVKGSELAVIKKGLDFKEVVSLAEITTTEGALVVAARPGTPTPASPSSTRTPF